jgi:UDP-glucose 4-epimerase
VELARKQVVVTGGAGFIGSHVVDALVDVGADVVVIDDLSVGSRRNVAEAEEAGAKLVVGDVRDTALMGRELSDADAVVHMACDNLRASLGNPMNTHEVNATGTLVTCLAAARHEVERFVYVSSSEAYGSARTVPMSEEHPLEPTTVYGASKAAGELYAQGCMRTYGMPVTIVRPFNSYGPREHSTGTSAEVVPKFVNRLRAGLPPVIFGDGSQTRDFTWVEETAAGIVAATACDELVGEAINIAYGAPVSIRQICEHLIDILDADVEPSFDQPRPGDVTHHYADTTKAREVLGFEATVPVRDGLRRFVDWLEQEGEGRPAHPGQAVRNW